MVADCGTCGGGGGGGGVEGAGGGRGRKRTGKPEVRLMRHDERYYQVNSIFGAIRSKIKTGDVCTLTSNPAILRIELAW